MEFPDRRRRLLRAHRKKRRGRRTTEKRDELAPSHCPRASRQRMLSIDAGSLEEAPPMSALGQKQHVRRAAKSHVRSTPESGHVRCN